MGNAGITDRFGRTQDLIADLVFEPWSETKVLELRSMLMDLPIQGDHDRTALVQRAIDLVAKLADLEDEVETESDAERAAKIMRKLATDHERLLEQLRSWFRF